MKSNEQKVVILLKASMVIALIGGVLAGLLLASMNPTNVQIALALVVFAGLQLNLLLTRQVVVWIQDLGRAERRTTPDLA